VASVNEAGSPHALGFTFWHSRKMSEPDPLTGCVRAALALFSAASTMLVSILN
jgi:hypothetical protein